MTCSLKYYHKAAKPQPLNRPFFSSYKCSKDRSYYKKLHVIGEISDSSYTLISHFMRVEIIDVQNVSPSIVFAILYKCRRIKASERTISWECEEPISDPHREQQRRSESVISVEIHLSVEWSVRFIVPPIHIFFRILNFWSYLS